MTAWAALDGIRLAQCTELVADSDDVVLFVRCESDVVHTWTIATGHCGVMHGWLAAHPRSVDGSFGIPDVFGNAEAQVFHVVDGLWHIRSDLVEVIQAHQGTWDVGIVRPCKALTVFNVVEELIWEAHRIDHAHGVTNAAGEAFWVTANFGATCFVESNSLVQILRGANAVGERCYRWGLTLAQDQVVVDELFVGTKVERFLIFVGDDEAEGINVELARLGKVSDDDFHVCTAQNIWGLYFSHDDSLGFKKGER